jgi:signal transduction histidine kinase
LLRERILSPLAEWMARRSRWEVGMFMLLLVMAIGLLDYVTGIEVSLSVVYAIPVSITAWYVGAVPALGLALLSVIVWIAGDLAAGLHPSNIMVPFFNALVRLVFYAFLTHVLVRLRYLQKNLEDLARVRAVALSHEIAERERLEREMLEISEREQRRIGQDLHDSLCQYLTGTAMAGQLLAEKLTRRELPEPREARKVVDLIEEAITLARGMAKGLHPVEMKSDGLMQALEEFCVSTSELFAVDCHFDCQMPVLIESQSTAIHLYRIAQEGVGNAIKHGRPTRIIVQLEEIEEGTQLVISDNGSGLPASAPSGNGMGLRIIADRAKMIGGRFRVDRGRFGGAELSCLIPHSQAAE